MAIAEMISGRGESSNENTNPEHKASSEDGKNAGNK